MQISAYTKYIKGYGQWQYQMKARIRNHYISKEIFSRVEQGSYLLSLYKRRKICLPHCLHTDCLATHMGEVPIDSHHVILVISCGQGGWTYLLFTVK